MFNPMNETAKNTLMPELEQSAKLLHNKERNRTTQHNNNKQLNNNKPLNNKNTMVKIK